MYVGIQLLAFFIVTGQFGFPVASQFIVAAEAGSFCLGDFKLLCCRVESPKPARKIKIKRNEYNKNPVKKVVCYGGESRGFFLVNINCFVELSLYAEGDQSAKKQCPNGLLGYCCPPDTDPVSNFLHHL